MGKKGNDEFVLEFMNVCMVFIGFIGAAVLFDLYVTELDKKEAAKVENNDKI